MSDDDDGGSIGLALLVGTLVVLAVVHWAGTARAHDDAQWIQDGQYRNAAGQLCCGRLDCFQLPDGDVAVTAAGYLIKSIRETVPYSQAMPSPDGKFWRCAWGGERKCFFAPPPGS